MIRALAQKCVSVEMNFHAVTKSLLKQTNPNVIYRVSAKRISRMIHHPVLGNRFSAAM
jgi:hypothetical protein